MNLLKKKITNALLLFVLAVTSMSASEKSTINVAGDNAIVVTFDQIQSQKAYARLIDEEGTELWSTIIRKSSYYQKKINLKNLPSGIYNVIFKDGDITFTQKIKKELQAITVLEDSKLVAFAPTTRFDNNRLSLHYPTSKAKLLSVVFLNEEGDVIHRDEPVYQDGYNRMYDLSNLEKGEYLIMMKTKLNTNYKSVLIK